MDFTKLAESMLYYSLRDQKLVDQNINLSLDKIQLLL